MSTSKKQREEKERKSGTCREDTRKLMKKQHLYRALVAVFVLAGVGTVGCGREDQTNNNSTNASTPDMETMAEPDVPEDTPDLGEPDMPVDEPDMPDEIDMTPTCEPLTACPVDACGAIDDGCGGMVTCDVECACVDGRPRQATCGPCGLGRASCTSEGEIECELPAVPGLEAQACEQVLFVDSSTGGLKAGTRTEPFADLASALDRIEGSEPWVIVLAGAREYTFDGLLELPASVSVVGGYALREGEWLYDTSEVSTVRAGGKLDPMYYDVAGMRLRNVSTPVLIEGLELYGPDAADVSENAFGLVVQHTTGELTLERMKIHAGVGMPGAPGQEGVDGDDGPDAPDTAERLISGDGPHLAPSPTAIAGCPDSVGGKGGKGTSIGSALDAEWGENSILAALGGEPGRVGPSSGQDGKPGEDGDDGVDGAHGKSPTMGSPGQVLLGRWIFAGDGAPGEDGAHGVGGGGGGGSVTGSAPDGLPYAGGTGGTGGHGGCGGTGGKGGQRGGSSIALLVMDLSAPVRIHSSIFEAGQAGDGGNGGEGGKGGDGGKGGKPTTRTNASQLLFNPGAPGGDGGDGGDGGPGAGGRGGLSIAAFCTDVVELDETSSFEFNAVTSRGGFGASGGTDGRDGRLLDQVGCQP